VRRRRGRFTRCSIIEWTARVARRPARALLAIDRS
jgi:hypothetical protein